jgi:hypothetical protein
MHKPFGPVRYPRYALPAHAADMEPSVSRRYESSSPTSGAFGIRDCPGARSTQSRNDGLAALNESARPDAAQLDPTEDSAAKTFLANEISRK